MVSRSEYVKSGAHIFERPAHGFSTADDGIVVGVVQGEQGFQIALGLVRLDFSIAVFILGAHGRR